MRAKRHGTGLSEPVRPVKKGAAKDARGTPPTARARTRVITSPVHDKLDDICAQIEAGMPVRSACWSCGISPDALDSRMRDDIEVRARIETARARGEGAHLARLDAAIEEGKPTAGLTWKIERLYPATWHQATKVSAEVSHTPAGPEQRARLREALDKLDAIEATVVVEPTW